MPVNFPLRATLGAALVAAATGAGAQNQVVKPPISQAWIDVATFSGMGMPGMGMGGANPAAQSAGPATFAERREQVGLAMKALDQLPERDRKLMEWHAADVPLEEIALRLGIAYDAAKHARQRALEKFRDAARRFGIAGA